MNPAVIIVCLTEIQSAPHYLLQRMKRYIKQNSLLKSDEAWIVMDKDEWTDQQLQELMAWSRIDARYGLALSNPNFKYWLLLH